MLRKRSSFRTLFKRLAFIFCSFSSAWIALKSCRVPEKIRSTGRRSVLGAEIAQRDGCRKGERKAVKGVKQTKERDTFIGSGERSRTLRRGRRQNRRKRAGTKVRLNFLRLAGPAGVKWEWVCYTRYVTHESRNERPRRLCTKDCLGYRHDLSTQVLSNDSPKLFINPFAATYLTVLKSDAWFVFFFFSAQPKFCLTIQRNTVCEIGQFCLIIVFSPGRFVGYAWPEITRSYDGETRSPWNSFRPTSIKLPGINKYDATLFHLNVWYFVDEKTVARNERLRIKSFAREFPSTQKGHYFYQTISYLLSYLVVSL